MVSPINYRMDVLSPVEGYLQGLRFGEGLLTERQGRENTALQMQEREQMMALRQAQESRAAQEFETRQAETARQRAQAEAMQEQLMGLREMAISGTLTPEALNQFALANASTFDEFRTAFDAMGEGRRQADTQFALQLSTSLLRGNTEAALNMLDTRIAAAENTGTPQSLEEAQRLRAIRGEAEIDPVGFATANLANLTAQGALDSSALKTVLEASGQSSEATTAFQTLDLRARAAGLTPGTPEYQRFMLEGGPQVGLSLTVGADGSVQVAQGPGVTGMGAGVGQTGPLGQGEALVQTDAGLEIVPIPGGAAARAAEEAERRAEGRQTQVQRAGQTVIQDLQRALDLIPELGALARGEGVVGGVARAGQARIPGTVANRITQFTESALSNVGLDTLQQMRENSPTGGALGQVPIQQQTRLEQVLGSLNINQPPNVLASNIQRVMNIYTDIIYGSPAERDRAVREGRMTPEQSAEIDTFYFQLPFDERGRPIGGAQPVPEQPAPAPAAGAIPQSFLTNRGVIEAAANAGVTPEAMWSVMTPEMRARYGE
jgi:hypothetical protein